MIEPAPVAPTAAFRGRWRDWTADLPRGQFWTYFFASVFFNLGFSVFFFLFNVYLVGLGMNERTLGLIGSCAAAGSLVGTIPAGILGQRCGLRFTLIGGILLAVLASALRVWMLALPAQLCLAFLAGLGLCTWAVSLSPAVASLTSGRQRPRAFSLMFAFGIGDAGLGAIAAGHAPGWCASLARHPLSLAQCERITLLLGCALALVATIPISRLSLASPAAPTRFSRPSAPFLRRFLPAMGVWSLVVGAFPPFANVYFVHHLGLPLSSIGWVFSGAQLAQFGAILLVPLLLRHLRLGLAVTFTQLGTAVALLSLASTHTILHAAWLYWIYTAVQFSNEPGIFSLLMQGVPASDRASASSYTFFVSSGANMIGSAAIGMTILKFGYPTSLCGIALLAIVAAALFSRLAIWPPVST